MDVGNERGAADNANWGEMANYILRRLLQSVFVLVGVTVICFVMFQYMGDPALALVGMDASKEQIAEVSRKCWGSTSRSMNNTSGLCGGRCKGISAFPSRHGLPHSSWCSSVCRPPSSWRWSR